MAGCLLGGSEVQALEDLLREVEERYDVERMDQGQDLLLLANDDTGLSAIRKEPKKWLK